MYVQYTNAYNVMAKRKDQPCNTPTAKAYINKATGNTTEV